jgi:nicotinamide riboside transporter PnuC
MEVNKRRTIAFFFCLVLMYLYFVVSDYIKFVELNLLVNFLKALVIMAVLTLLMWLFGGRRKGKNSIR